MKSTNIYFGYEQTGQKILFHPFREAQNTKKVIETRQTSQSLKTKFLFFGEGELFLKEPAILIN